VKIIVDAGARELRLKARKRLSLTLRRVQVRKHSQGEGSTTFKPPADGAPASPDKGGGATSPYAQPFQHNNTPAAAPAVAAPPIPDPDYSMSEVR
jgi:hypothetical protein